MLGELEPFGTTRFTADHCRSPGTDRPFGSLRKWKFLRGNVRSRPVQSVLRALWMGRRIPALIAAAKAAA